MRRYSPFLVLALVLVSSPHALAQGAPGIEAPRDQGVVLGSAVEIEVTDASAAPTIFIDGAPVSTAWTALPYAGRWHTVVPLAKPGQHVLEVAANGGSRTARFDSVTGAREALPVGDSVARHFLARHPATTWKWSWSQAVLVYGLHEFAGASPQGTTYSKAVADFYAAQAGTSHTIDRPDPCAPALGALALARREHDNVGIPAARKVADYIANEKRDPLGAIDHLGSSSIERWLCQLSVILRPWTTSIWCDSLMMYGVFSVQWGASQNDPRMLDFGASQPARFARVLQDPKTGLFNHAWDWKKNQPLGTCWLRGNGWVGTSIVEMLDELPAGHARRPELEQVLKDLAAGLESKQMANGLWDCLVDDPGELYAESSGSALAAYALAKGARLGVLPPAARERARHAFAALTARLARRSDGDLSVTGTSTATNATPEWIYKLIPQADDVDYGVGAYLLLASELAPDAW